jgi:hypothetical protein
MHVTYTTLSAALQVCFRALTFYASGLWFPAFIITIVVDMQWAWTHPRNAHHG